MNTATVIRLSGQFAAASAVVLALFVGVGSADAANTTLKTQFVAPKAPVVANNGVSQRQIAIEPRQQQNVTAKFVAPKAPTVEQPQKNLTTFQLTPKAPVVDQQQIVAPKAPVVDQGTKVAAIDQDVAEVPADKNTGQQVQQTEQQTEQQIEAPKKPVSIENLAEGDRVFEDNGQYIIMHKDGTYDLVAKNAKKKIVNNNYYTYSDSYGYNSYNSYSGSYYNAPSYSNYGYSGYSGYGYDNCQ